jgi:putative ABC transport system permease protein
MKKIESVFSRHSPLFPFEYFFLDDAFDRLYRSEERFELIFKYFSLLAIGIALLGLFSLSAYTSQQKSREIGIRKILGATSRDIMRLFSNEVALLILAANIIAAPLAIYTINLWLNNFAYRVSINPWVFVLVLAGSFGAALGTISFQLIKAAHLKPVDEIRVDL